MKQRFKFRHVNEITGTFVILVMVVVIAAVVWTAHSQGWFRGTVTLRIVLPEAGAAGIRQGSEVYFLGTLVGTVSDVLVAPTGRMEARTRIRSDFFRFVREDSSAVVKKKFGVAGDAYFDIARGEGPPLPSKNASIICKELPMTMEATVDEVRRTVLPVLEKLSVGVDTWTAYEVSWLDPAGKPQVAIATFAGISMCSPRARIMRRASVRGCSHARVCMSGQRDSPERVTPPRATPGTRATLAGKTSTPRRGSHQPTATPLNVPTMPAITTSEANSAPRHTRTRIPRGSDVERQKIILVSAPRLMGVVDSQLSR